MSAERYVTPRVIDHLRAELPNVPRKHRPAFTTAQCVLRHLARWARRDADGCWLSTDAVSQIRVGCGLSEGTVRDCLEALRLVGLVTVLRRGGGHGLTARGSTRWIHLDVPDARMNKTDEQDGIAGQSRGVGDQIPRSWGSNPAQMTPSTARDHPTEFRWVPAPAARSRMWADDSDIEAAPPSIAETLAAIRAWRAGGDAPVLTPAAPPAPPPPQRRYGGPLDT